MEAARDRERFKLEEGGDDPMISEEDLAVSADKC
jgi:hypothetical protein